MTKNGYFANVVSLIIWYGARMAPSWRGRWLGGEECSMVGGMEWPFVHNGLWIWAIWLAICLLDDTCNGSISCSGANLHPIRFWAIGFQRADQLIVLCPWRVAHLYRGHSSAHRQCTYMHTYIHTYTHMHTYIHSSMRAMCMHPYMPTYTHT
jgi:hypothetical protein